MPESNADGGDGVGKVTWPDIPRLKQKFDKDGLPLGPLEQPQQTSPVRIKGRRGDGVESNERNANRGVKSFVLVESSRPFSSGWDNSSALRFGRTVRGTAVWTFPLSWKEFVQRRHGYSWSSTTAAAKGGVRE